MPATHSTLEILGELMLGNQRFVEGNLNMGDDIIFRREALARYGQNPLAVVVTCSDSRVVPEIVFDHPKGSLFVVRLPGNVITRETVAAIEFAVLSFPVKLIMIMGHTRCGAIQSVLNPAPTQLPVALTEFLESIKNDLTFEPALVNPENLDDFTTELAKQNTEVGARRLLAESTFLSEQVRSGPTGIITSLYCLHTGVVEILSQYHCD